MVAGDAKKHVTDRLAAGGQGLQDQAPSVRSHRAKLSRACPPASRILIAPTLPQPSSPPPLHAEFGRDTSPHGATGREEIRTADVAKAGILAPRPQYSG